MKRSLTCGLLFLALGAGALAARNTGESQDA